MLWAIAATFVVLTPLVTSGQQRTFQDVETCMAPERTKCCDNCSQRIDEQYRQATVKCFMALETAQLEMAKNCSPADILSQPCWSMLKEPHRARHRQRRDAGGDGDGGHHGGHPNPWMDIIRRFPVLSGAIQCGGECFGQAAKKCFEGCNAQRPADYEEKQKKCWTNKPMDDFQACLQAASVPSSGSTNQNGTATEH